VTSEVFLPAATAPKPPSISFEFFPPKTEEMERNLWEVIGRLAPLAPNFVSVTYGAGGSTRERTHATIARILAETSLTPAAHLTCVDAARADIDDVAGRHPERLLECDIPATLFPAVERGRFEVAEILRQNSCLSCVRLVRIAHELLEPGDELRNVLRCHRLDEILVDHDRRRESAGAEALHLDDSELAVGRRLAELLTAGVLE